jgi:hypothetical protein
MKIAQADTIAHETMHGAYIKVKDKTYGFEAKNELEACVMAIQLKEIAEEINRREAILCHQAKTIQDLGGINSNE